MNQTHFLDFAIETAKSSGNILLKHFGNISSFKRKSSDSDLLTAADTASELWIINKITSLYPDHKIYAEESPIKEGSSDYCWVIDPLDGTTNYVHNLPIFAVSIGLQYKQETILGVVYNPAADKCFWAEKNRGAFLNGKRIHPSSTNTLSNSMLVTGFPYIQDVNWENSFELFKIFYSKSQGIRRLGAAALDFCFVAMGRFEGFWEYGLQPWDICAGALILKEAGGKMTDWSDVEMPFSGEKILATNGYIHEEMLQILQSELNS